MNTNRMLRATVGQLPDNEGPDYESFVLSVTVPPKLVNVWVRWYQGSQGSEVYQKNMIKAFRLRGYESLDGIRKAIDSIQEWAAIDGFQQRQPLFQQIRDHARRIQEDMLVEVNYKSLKLYSKSSPEKRKLNVDNSPERDNQISAEAEE